VRINCLNLPMIKSADAAHELRPPSMRVIYNSPSYVASQEDEQVSILCLLTKEIDRPIELSSLISSQPGGLV